MRIHDELFQKRQTDGTPAFEALSALCLGSRTLAKLRGKTRKGLGVQDFGLLLRMRRTGVLLKEGRFQVPDLFAGGRVGSKLSGAS